MAGAVFVERNEVVSLHNDSAIGSVFASGVQLRCPRCGANVDQLCCVRCKFEMKLRDGIVLALPPERAMRYARFTGDYERIRAAEGRGSNNREFYLSLPYKDTSGRNSHQWAIRSKSYDYLAAHVLQGMRAGASVLDIGSGNCWMSYRLALRGYKPVAVDLLTNENDGLGAAIHYEEALRAAIPRFQAEAAYLPFRDAQFDVVIFNASFHYAEDYEATLREALRCLRAGGSIVIADTPWYARDESGKQMVAERQAYYRQRFGTPSDSVHSMEYLTDERLEDLEKKLSISWSVHNPWYGWKWSMRPLIAKLRRRREPSRFRIYTGRKDA